MGPDAWVELNHRLRTVNTTSWRTACATSPASKAPSSPAIPTTSSTIGTSTSRICTSPTTASGRYCFTNLREFLNREQPDGYVNRSLNKQRDRQDFKPFLAQLVVLGAKQNNDDYEWLRGNYYDRLTKYLVKWFSYDSDHNGLPVWNSADAAGTDNQWSRAGALGSFEIEGVDLA